MKLIKVKCTDCNNKDILKICIRCGFVIYNRPKHDKIKTKEGKFITMVPRNNPIKKETARGIFTALQEAGAPIAIIR